MLKRQPRQHGTVAAYDEAVGLGVVVGDDGREYPFHCTQIADGSRTIDSGAQVAFDVVPGRLGRWEAAWLTPALSVSPG